MRHSEYKGVHWSVREQTWRAILLHDDKASLFMPACSYHAPWGTNVCHERVQGHWSMHEQTWQAVLPHKACACPSLPHGSSVYGSETLNPKPLNGACGGLEASC